MLKRIAIVGVVLASVTGQILADGKIFGSERVPPEIPYQRALVLFRDGIETLVLQSKYKIPGAAENSIMGWAVPVPAVPEIASMSADKAFALFRILSVSSLPRVTKLSVIIFFVLFLIAVSSLLLALLFCFLSPFVPLPQWFIRNRRNLLGHCVLATLLVIIAALLLPTLGGIRGLDRVDVIAEHRVGIYDVSVIRSDSATELMAWLNERDFAFGYSDTAAFESYVSDGWCFVVAEIRPGAGMKAHEIMLEGLAAPLILRFPHEKPVYPLALTGTGGFETEILLYLASSTRMTCDDRLTLRFAGEMRDDCLGSLLRNTTPEDFFYADDMDYRYLCRFKNRLTPAEMKEDIVFEEADDEKPYREHVIEW